jgi:hypothetical protein
MANEEHVRIASWGAGGIDRWRAGFGIEQVLDLSGADLKGIDLSRAKLRHADFRGADLERANFFNSQADLANFEGANLRSARFEMASLCSANFSQADLTKANFWSADLSVANLNGANLREVILNYATLNRTLVSGAHFGGAEFLQTKLLNMDLSEAVGLDRISQRGGVCSIGVETLYQSKGRIPDNFLKHCGLSSTLITYLHSLVGRAIEFFSCFISYTEADDDFSQRLYNDLQGEGVRCWRWRDDAKWGSTLIGEVDLAIRLYDKLIVILSEHSLQSEPVIREIERALQKEAREKKEVLFPITLDDAIFSWQHPLAADVMRKVIGDFRQWKDPAAYKNSLKRLLDTLKSSSA